jgi:hypothetical protein
VAVAAPVPVAALVVCAGPAAGEPAVAEFVPIPALVAVLVVAAALVLAPGVGLELVAAPDPLALGGIAGHCPGG